MYNKTKILKKVSEPYLSEDRTRFPPETGVSSSTWSAEGAGVLGSVGSVLATVLDAVVVVVAFSVAGWRIEDDVLAIIFSFSLYSDLAKTFLFTLQELFSKNEINKEYYKKITTDELPEMNLTLIILFFVNTPVKSSIIGIQGWLLNLIRCLFKKFKVC